MDYSVCEKALCVKPTKIYLLKVSNKDTRKAFRICSKFTKKTLEQRYWSRSGVLIANFYCWLWVGICLLGYSNIQIQGWKAGFGSCCAL